MREVSPVTHCPNPAAWLASLNKRWKLDPATGCHLWTGPIDNRDRTAGSTGYGRFRRQIDGKRRETGAHRAMYLAAVGDIPEGMQIDHLCRQRLCVNVEHMEVVTLEENMRRAVRDAPQWGRSRGAGDQYGCTSHGRDDGYERSDRRGYTRWVCRICTAARNAKWKAAHKARRDSAA